MAVGRLACDTVVAADLPVGTLHWFDATGAFLFQSGEPAGTIDAPQIRPDRRSR